MVTSYLNHFTSCLCKVMNRYINFVQKFRSLGNPSSLHLRGPGWRSPARHPGQSAPAVKVN